MGDLAWNVGRVRITRVVENEVPLALGELIPEATPDALLAHRAWLQPHFLDAGRHVRLSIHGLVVESGGRRILVDTCVGQARDPRLRGDLIAGGRPSSPSSSAPASRPRRSTSSCVRTCTSTTSGGTRTRAAASSCRASRARATSSRAPSGSTGARDGQRRLRADDRRRGAADRRRRARRPRRGRPRSAPTVRLVPSPGPHARPRVRRDRVGGRARAHHRRRDAPPGAVGRARLEDGRGLRLRAGRGDAAPARAPTLADRPCS